MVKRLTEQRLLNITLFYLSRYESSTEKVRAMLRRRLKRMEMRGEEVPAEAPTWIESVLKKVQDYSYVNDDRYAENQVRTLAEQGRSERFICAKLGNAGIKPEKIRELLEAIGSTEEERARRFIFKKKIGPYRPESVRNQYQKKDMAALARAGFLYEVVQTVLKSSDDFS